MAKVLVKRYPNRKLYDTQAKRYITLDSISDLILQGHDVEVRDHETGEDLTGVTLSQIIFEREKKDAGYLPSALFATLIRTGGDTLEYMKRSLQTSVGALRSLEAELDQRIDILVRRGDLAVEEAEALRTTGERQHLATEALNVVDQRIETALHKLNIPSRVDMLRLQKQIDELATAIDAILAEGASTPDQPPE